MERNPEEAGFDPARLNRITEHLDRNYIQSGKIAGCQALVARHGQVAYFESLGCADAERSTPMRDDTIFRIYSMSKPITSVALMQLYEQGHFQLNDPVSRVIPGWRDQKVWVSGDADNMELKAPDGPMTFRHVLSHSGGLTYGATNHPVDKVYRRIGVNRDRNETLSTFMERIGQTPLRYEPGTAWLYSLSTDVCGGLVEAISGMPFDEYLQKNIFDPLEMADTSFWVAPEKQKRFAANYQRNPDKTLKLIDDPERSAYLTKPGFFSGGGGLTSTTADYLRFCEMLRRGGELGGARILGPRTIDLMHKNHLAGGRDLAGMAIGAFSETAYEGVGFGLGFAMTLGEVEAGTLGEGDYYWGGAASTIFWVDPKEDLVAIFMTQLMPSATFNFRGQLKNIIYSAIVD
ncbi:MAG: beta-lactamase family protein [Dehalococcoidia bacterium]|uniref:serine hydrolase domain-containing protein n=1 Tax=Candidatus Amarobacter glycogenicus TaxID=3140699 RepID=UPI003135E36A|nr:beta-lactamase family protein [Dehalococcoidia bacterium]